MEEDIQSGLQECSYDQETALNWAECLRTLRDLHLSGFLPPLFVVSRAPMGEDVLAYVYTTGGRVLPGEVTRGPLPMCWVSHCVYPYHRDVYLGAPFVESGGGLEEYDDDL